MRYPKTSFMTRTLPRNVLASKCPPTFVPTRTPSCRTIKSASPKPRTSKPETNFKDGPNVFWDQILGDLRQYFVDYAFPVAFEKLKKWEDHSVTSYLLLEKKVPYPIVKWRETMNSRTGLFDQSLVETVLASLVFMGPNSMDQVEW